MTTFDRWVPWLFLCFWSAGYSVGKVALEYTTPLNLLAFRFGATALALAPLILIWRLTLPAWESVKALAGLAFFYKLAILVASTLVLSWVPVRISWRSSPPRNPS